jgi:hypothetical protein
VLAVEATGGYAASWRRKGERRRTEDVLRAPKKRRAPMTVVKKK